MRSQPTQRALINHPPQAYYEAWAEAYGLDKERFPYIRMEFVPTKGQMMPFAVFDFEIKKDENGQRVALAEVWYKSIFSKDSFRVLKYL